LSGVATAAVIPSGMAYLKNCYLVQKERNVAMAFVVSGGMLGATVGPRIGGAVHSSSPLFPFEMVVVIGLIVLVLSWLFLPKLHGFQEHVDSNISVMYLLPDRGILWALILLVFANAIPAHVYSNFHFFSEKLAGFSPAEVGLLMLLNALLCSVTSALGGPVANCVGEVVVLLTSACIQGVSMILMPRGSVIVETISFIGVATGMGMINGVVPSFLSIIAAQKFSGTGKVYVLSNIAVQWGVIVGPVFGSFASFQVTCLIFGSALIMVPGVAFCLANGDAALSALKRKSFVQAIGAEVHSYALGKAKVRAGGLINSIMKFR